MKMSEYEETIEARKEKALAVFKNPKVWVLGFLIIAIILGAYIRSMPMQDHGGKPGLWDIARDNWTLGPDLDPWFFTRYAKTIVEEGDLPANDRMRNVPLGYDTARETKLLPYMIVWTYSFVNIFGDYSIEFAAAIFPVIMFVLTILAFFLFVREIFIREKKNTRANIIALVSTFFLIVIPVFLSRTIAGIPEKESAAFFFMFLAFYFFLKAWKSQSMKGALILSILAGISTAAMGLIWGGVSYVFVAVGVASMIAFILNKVHKKEIMAYSVWIISSFLIMSLLSGRFSLSGLIESLDTGLAFMVFFVLLVHFLLWNTKLSKMKIFQNKKLPKHILSLIIAIVLGILLVSILIGPGFIFGKLKAVNQMMFKPITGRWDVTVAENRQPYFTEWAGNFGPFIKNFPVLFWLFFIGSVVLIKKMFRRLKKKDSLVLTGLYIFFFFGLVFSRYAAEGVFNGNNFISKAFYYLSALLFIGWLIYYYIQYYKEDHKGFEKVRFEYLFLFSFFVLCLFTARSAVRLVMVLGTVAPILVSYLLVESFDGWKKSRGEGLRVFMIAIMVLVIFLSLFSFWTFYSTVKVQAYNFVPSPYNQQWQKAMDWVREGTPVETTVFAHWWDYGYWLQSIGNRATVLDGGNNIPYWNYLMGRHVLTGDNQHDALEFLYNHNATHLLIDSTDIGKYGAYSSIGSNETFDRYSWMNAMVVDDRQTMETANSSVRVYQGGRVLDEDIIYEKDGAKIFLPGGKAGVAGVILKASVDNGEIIFEQPQGVFVYNGQQIEIPLRYLYLGGQFIDFGFGLEGAARLIQRVTQTSEGMEVDNLGAMMYISPRVLRGFFGQEYLLNGVQGNFPNFEVVHKEPFKLTLEEPDTLGEYLKNSGVLTDDLVYVDGRGLQGPIVIWEIEYTGREQLREEYVGRDAEDYLDWAL